MSTAVYVEQIIASIKKKQNEILDVKDFELIKMVDYTATNQKKISELIQNGQIAKLKDLSGIALDVNKGYDLMIVKYSDTLNRHYFAIVYDSEDLWQDPEVLETFLVPEK